MSDMMLSIANKLAKLLKKGMTARAQRGEFRLVYLCQNEMIFVYLFRQTKTYLSYAVRLLAMKRHGQHLPNSSRCQWICLFPVTVHHLTTWTRRMPQKRSATYWLPNNKKNIRHVPFRQLPKIILGILAVTSYIIADVFIMMP